MRAYGDDVVGLRRQCANDRMERAVTTKVGFIGLGSQGGPMARRIVEEGYPLTIWARSPATLEPFRDTAAT